MSRVGYVLFGLFMLNETAFQGALLHVYFHSIMKNLLFLCAGGIILKTGLTDVRDLRGIGKRMPATLWCFTLAGVSLVGVPPLCGFFSKWELAQGAMASGVATFQLAWTGGAAGICAAHGGLSAAGEHQRLLPRPRERRGGARRPPAAS